MENEKKDVFEEEVSPKRMKGIKSQIRKLIFTVLGLGAFVVGLGALEVFLLIPYALTFVAVLVGIMMLISMAIMTVSLGDLNKIEVPLSCKTLKAWSGILMVLIIVLTIAAVVFIGISSSFDLDDLFSSDDEGYTSSQKTCRFIENDRYVCSKSCVSGSNFCRYHTDLMMDAYNEAVGRYEELTGGY